MRGSILPFSLGSRLLLSIWLLINLIALTIHHHLVPHQKEKHQ
jgi:hypothetical protein